MIRVVIDGRPISKGRARMTALGRAYTPAKTRAYESHGRMAAQIAMGGRSPLDGSLSAVVTAKLPVPASWSAKKRAAALSGVVLPVSRPDIDNYLKSCFDALNGIVWKDDSQIVEVFARKIYAEKPQLIIEVTPI